jgi:hypothetical protein
MPKIVDGTIWWIEQTRRINKARIYRALLRVARAEGPEPSPDNLESYSLYWERVSAMLASQFD